MNDLSLMQGWRNLRVGGGGGACAPPPQILADQLTLSQRGGGQIMPNTLPHAPHIFRPSAIPVVWTSQIWKQQLEKSTFFD